MFLQVLSLFFYVFTLKTFKDLLFFSKIAIIALQSKTQKRLKK